MSILLGMADLEEDYHLVEHELHSTETSLKPMVELEIAQSMVDSVRAHLVSSESTLANTSDELERLRALAARQNLLIASMQRTIATRDTTLEHCTSSLMSTTSQYQTALSTINEHEEEIQTLKAQLAELSTKHTQVREELEREMEEFKAYKQAHVHSRRMPPPKADNRGFMSTMMEPTLFR